MLEWNEIDKIRADDVKKMEKIKGKADEIAGQKMAAIQKKGEDLKNKLAELIEKKGNLFMSPCSKPELLELAKKALREGRQNLFFDGVLIPHLGAAQKHQAIALSPGDVQRNLCSERNVWKLAYCFITESDIEKAVEALPDIGLSEVERTAQVKKLDSEIMVLENQIENELKKI